MHELFIELAESGAIVEYIIDTYGKGRLKPKPGTDDYWRYVEWMHFAEGSLMSLMLIALVLSRVPEASLSPVKGRILERMIDPPLNPAARPSRGGDR